MEFNKPFYSLLKVLLCVPRNRKCVVVYCLSQIITFPWYVLEVLKPVLHIYI
jgi:hypothetical protein